MIALFVFSVFLDVHSTCLAINNGRKEVLLPFKTCRSISWYSAVSTVGVVGFTVKKPKYQKFILIAGILAHSTAAIYNYKHK